MGINLNVFKYDYLPWKKPRNWISNIRQFFRNFKYAYQRITKGYCDRDIWNLDCYYASILSKTLYELGEHSCGYPCVIDELYKELNEEEKQNKWKELLKDASKDFAFYLKDDTDDNKLMTAFEKYHSHILGTKEELCDDDSYHTRYVIDDEKQYDKDKNAWLQEERRFENLRQEHISYGLKFLNKWYSNLWD